MAFPEGFKEEVRRAADLVAFVSDHVRLRKVGASWKGLCPFHQEKTPSFNVRGEFFHCFGCGEGGDIFKFAMLHDKLSFPEAVEAVAKRFGVPIPQVRVDSQAEARERKEREEVLAALEAAAVHFARLLQSPAGARAREYLAGRGFEKETLERIRAGYARESWDDLLQTLKRQFPATALLAAGLVIEKQEGTGHYDRFRNRVLFPILNEAGKVVAFGARSLDGTEPKYLNSPETVVYQKSRTLYGLSWARDEIRKRDQVVLMEGYLDVARAIECGVGEAVATCGTALTQQHARLLHRLAPRVLLNFDQDAAGQKAARKSLEMLLEEGLRVGVVELPEGHDPDSFLKAEGAAAYRGRLEEAPEVMEWLIRRGLAENDVRTPAGKAAFAGAILPALSRIDNAVERAAWVAQIATRGGLDLGATETELRRIAAAGGADRQPAPSPPPVRRSPMLRAEHWLLALALQGAEGSREALLELSEADIDGLAMEEALRAARSLAASGAPLSTHALLEAMASAEAQKILREIEVAPPPTGDATPQDCVRELRGGPLRVRMADIQKRLPGASGDDLDRLLREKTEILQRLANL